MRYDNDVKTERRGIREQVANFVRAHLSNPRRTAIAGLAAAAVGTGALALSAAPAPADATPRATAAASVQTLNDRADGTTVTRSLDRAGKPVTTAKTAKTAKKAGASPRAPRAIAKAKELRVKYQAQPNYYWCGPAATRNALTATGHNITMASLARTMGTTEAGTNSAHDITAALNKVTGGHKYHTTELAKSTVTAKQANTLQRDIVTTVNDHRAVVANVAGTATDTKGTSHSYEGGHYIAVHGYRDNGRQVEIADSADPKVARYWIDTIDLANWIATRGYSH